MKNVQLYTHTLTIGKMPTTYTIPLCWFAPAHLSSGIQVSVTKCFNCDFFVMLSVTLLIEQVSKIRCSKNVSMILQAKALC